MARDTEKKRIYPLYLAIDASGSMDQVINPFEETKRIDLAKQIPLAFNQLYEENQDLVSLLWVSVFLFNTKVLRVLPLSPVSQVREVDLNWNASGKTFFANLFSSLETAIRDDMKNVGEDFEVHNPAVVIVTDGIPSTVEEADEIESSRRSERQALLSIDGFNQSVQIAFMGIGSSREEFLQDYASSRGLAMKLDPAQPIVKQVEGLIAALKKTIRASLAKTDGSSEGGWMRSFFSEPVDDEKDDYF